MTILWSAEQLDSVGSTNTYALARATDGAAEGLIVVADHQTAGKGRLDRSWQDEPGSALLCSILFRPEGKLEPHLYGQAVGVAAAMACRVMGAWDVKVKWPNDVIAGERKVGGILVESSSTGGSIDALVVGCGVNLNWSPPTANDGLPPTSVADLAGRPVGRGDYLEALLVELDGLMEFPTSIPSAYRSECATIGEMVRVDMGTEEITGIAMDVLDDGRLVVETNDERRLIHMGDVVHLRNGPPSDRNDASD